MTTFNKTSKYLENCFEMKEKATDKFLMLLKSRGDMKTQDMAKALDISGEAVRQMLVKLEKQGLVRSIAQVSGVGRPVQLWSLTRQGHERFPDTHSELTIQLIQGIRQVFGEEGLDRLLISREKETVRQYEHQLEGLNSLEAKVNRLAEIRKREGYMAEWQKTADGGYMLVENHCPICAAATECQGFCRAELNTFRQALGEKVSIERTDHIVSGARRCAYRIKSS